MTIGKRIYLLRKERNMSQEDLSKKLYVSRQTIGRWESGQSLPTIYNIRRLREIFDITYDEFFSVC